MQKKRRKAFGEEVVDELFLFDGWFFFCCCPICNLVRKMTQKIHRQKKLLFWKLAPQQPAFFLIDFLKLIYDFILFCGTLVFLIENNIFFLCLLDGVENSIVFIIFLNTS